MSDRPGTPETGEGRPPRPRAARAGASLTDELLGDILDELRGLRRELSTNVDPPSRTRRRVRIQEPAPEETE